MCVSTDELERAKQKKFFETASSRCADEHQYRKTMKTTLTNLIKSTPGRYADIDKRISKFAETTTEVELEQLQLRPCKGQTTSTNVIRWASKRSDFRLATIVELIMYANSQDFQEAKLIVALGDAKVDAGGAFPSCYLRIDPCKDIDGVSRLHLKLVEGWGDTGCWGDYVWTAGTDFLVVVEKKQQP